MSLKVQIDFNILAFFGIDVCVVLVIGVLMAYFIIFLVCFFFIVRDWWKDRKGKVKLERFFGM